MDKKEPFNDFPFTTEQKDDIRKIKDDIRKILEKKFNPERIDIFIKELSFCWEGAACLLDQTDFKTYKNDRKSMMALLEKSSALLDEIRKGRGIYHLSNFSKLLSEERSELELECQELAVTADNLLRMLIRKIKRLDDSNEKRLKGRPNADSKGIVAEVAKIWEACFNKKPTKYIAGPFAEVVKIVLEGLNLKYESPERKIKAALE